MSKKKRMKASIITGTMILGAILLLGSCGYAGGSDRTAKPVVTESPSYELLVRESFVDPAIPRITAEELKLRMDRKEKMVIIDNRSDYKFQMGHLGGAVNIPCAIDSPYTGAERAMDAKLALLANDVLKVFYCD